MQEFSKTINRGGKMKNFSLLLKQFILLSLLIMVPVISITFVSNYTILKYSETEISKAAIGKLEVAERISDLVYQTIINDTVKLSLSKKFNDINDKNDIKIIQKDSNDIYKLFDFQSVLADVVRTNNLYSSLYFYLDNSNYIVTSNGVYLRDEFEDKEWIEVYIKNKKSSEPISWISPRPIDSNGSRHVISYIFPLSSYTTNIRGAIAINLSERSLSELINSDNFNTNDYISIIDSKGNVISYVDKSHLSTNVSNKAYVSRILNSDEKKGYFTDSINGKKVLITYLKTDMGNWVYFGVSSLDALNQKINSQRLKIIYISIGLLILGIFLSFMISRKIYNPVKKLAADIKLRRGVDIIGNDNEVTLLSKTFDAMIKEEDQLFNNIEKSKKYLRENYLLGLLRGKVASDDEQLGLFPYKNFICSIIDIDKYKDFVANFSDEHQYYLKTVILNLTEKTIGTSFTCSGIVMEGGRIVVIINFDNTEINYVHSFLKESFMIIQKESAKIIETTITVCLGNMYDNIEKVRTSYNEAQNLLKFRFILGYEKIICDIDKNACNSKYFYPFNMEKQILNNVDTGSKKALLVSLNDLINEIKANKDLTFDNVMLILNQLLGNTIKYLLNLNLSVSKIFGSNFNIYSQLAETETLDEAGLFLINIYLRIIEYRDQSKIDNKSHIAKIMEYIQNNYKQDIAINTLAEYVGLSYSHVRKVFNDETGENIVNYINNMRIEEAQRLLRQTSTNINDIALSLGYNNKQSFNRFFKKYVGINPGEYRSIKPS